MHRHRAALLAAVPLILAAAVSSSGVARATVPDESGVKYSDAKKALTGAGFTVVVASKIGDRTPLEKCVVVNQHLKGEAQTTKKKVTPTKVLVALECYDGAATATKPGTSAKAPTSKHG